MGAGLDQSAARPGPDGRNVVTDSRERGAIAVLLALLMVVLLGFAALAVDVGMLYAEKARLQTGADAAALAVAQDCATRGKASCQGTAHGKALGMAKANSSSGDGAVSSLAFSKPDPSGPETVDITVAASDADGSGVPLFFARIFGVSRAEVSARAAASWGSPSGGGLALPIVFSECQFDLTGTVQVLAMHGESGGRTCVSSSPSGQIIPGGFGWLESDPGKCGSTVSLAKPNVPSKPGVSEPHQCVPVFDALKNQTIIVPVFDELNAGVFRIKGFAAFQLTGFSFPGHSWNNTGSPGCTGSCKGLIGRFVQYTSLADFDLGGPDMGAKVVRLIR